MHPCLWLAGTRERPSPQLGGSCMRAPQPEPALCNPAACRSAKAVMLGLAAGCRPQSVVHAQALARSSAVFSRHTIRLQPRALRAARSAARSRACVMRPLVQNRQHTYVSVRLHAWAAAPGLAVSPGDSLAWTKAEGQAQALPSSRSTPSTPSSQHPGELVCNGVGDASSCCGPWRC
jgi:hypothetical protein